MKMRISLFFLFFLSPFVPSFRSVSVLSEEQIAGEEGDMSDPDFIVNQECRWLTRTIVTSG